MLGDQAGDDDAERGCGHRRLSPRLARAGTGSGGASRTATRPSPTSSHASQASSVLRRWAIMNVVRPSIRRSIASMIGASVADVDRARRLVEDQDRGVLQERAGERDPLALAAGEPHPALADQRVVAVRQPADEVVRVRRPRRRLDLARGSPRAARRRCSRRCWSRRAPAPAARSRTGCAGRRAGSRAGRRRRAGSRPRSGRRSASSRLTSVVLPAPVAPGDADAAPRARPRTRRRSSTGAAAVVAERRRRGTRPRPRPGRAAARAAARARRAPRRGARTPARRSRATDCRP